MKRKVISLSCLLGAATLWIGGVMQAQNAGQKTWSQQNAQDAFTAALTRSAYDQDFRDRLTASPESAKQAVAEEGQIAIPSGVVIIFHEDNVSETYHIFDLPEFDGNSERTHTYATHYQCCYPAW
jgi:hypothetical protein